MSVTTYIDPDGTVYSQQEHLQRIRIQYAKTPPPGYTAKEIENMGDEDLLDMDYFLNE